MTNSKTEKLVNLSKDVVRFIKGIGMGLQADMVNFKKCDAISQITLKDFEIAFLDIKHGLKEQNKMAALTGLKAFANGLQDVSRAFNDCGMNNLGKDIGDVAARLKFGQLGLLDIIVRETIHIFHHGISLTKEFDDAITMFELKDFKKSGYHVGKILSSLKDPL